MRGNFWSPEHDQLIKQLYADTPTADIAAALNRTERSVYSRAAMLGVKKATNTGRFTPGSVANFNTQFKKGQQAWNKGKKMNAFLSPEQITKIKETSFKKGITPHNTLYDGCITIRHDTKSKRPYKYIRISKGKWVLLQRHVWKQAHGSIPKNMRVIFIDGNTLNCELENLKLDTVQNIMRKNTIHRYPEEYKQVIKLKSKITRKIKNYGTKQNH